MRTKEHMQAELDCLDLLLKEQTKSVQVLEKRIMATKADMAKVSEDRGAQLCVAARLRKLAEELDKGRDAHITHIEIKSSDHHQMVLEYKVRAQYDDAQFTCVLTVCT